jgi:hypothetical protein
MDARVGLEADGASAGDIAGARADTAATRSEFEAATEKQQAELAARRKLLASAAKNHTIQINSSQCDKMSGEHYRMRLTPPIEVPYLAEPRVMLEQLAFTNAFVNVDSSAP